MHDLSPSAQQWIQVVLVWVGFGSLAGLVARVILPFREPSGPLPTLTLGITGSAVGLGVLSWFENGRAIQPISAIGFLSAIGGAFGLLLLYHVIALVMRHKKPAAVPRAAGIEFGDEE
jgi:uncharacterized membrane protein YeaQ/YmgE (transglycosylase-associated protein family)